MPLNCLQGGSSVIPFLERRWPVAPQIKPSPLKKALASPPVYRPKLTAASVQRSSAPVITAPRQPTVPTAYGPFKPAHAVQTKAAIRPIVPSPSVIQRWWCDYCRKDTQFSYQHFPDCRHYYLREYETAADRDANYYDRPRGAPRTRSASFDRQYSTGEDQRRHAHDNLYGPGGYVEHRR